MQVVDLHQESAELIFEIPGQPNELHLSLILETAS